MTKNLLKFPITLLVFFSILLPSGSIYGVNVKLAISVIALLLMACYLPKEGVEKKFLYALMGLISFLLFYTLIALNNGIPGQDIISHGTAISSLFLLIYLPTFAISKKIASKDEIIKIIFISLFVFSLFKLSISTAIWLGHEPTQVRLLLESIFGVSFIGLDTGSFYRVHWPADYLLPPALYFILQNKQPHYPFGKLQKNIFLAVFILAIIIAYSRLLYVYSLTAIALAFILANKDNNKKILIIALLVPTVLIYLLYSNSNMIADFISLRYSGEFAKSSDATRDAMLNALLQSFYDNFLLGRGLGAGTIGYINIEAVPWYFELQWLSIAMQFGIMGFIPILALALAPAVISLNINRSKYNLGLIIIYFFWLMVGIFNGFMLTSAGGVIFLLFITSLPTKKPKLRNQYRDIN